MKITFLTGHLAKERHMLLFELAEDLSKCGAKVTVITGFPSRRISEETRQYYLEHPVEIINENLVVKRVGSKRGEGKGLLQRYFRYINLVKAIKKEAKRTDSDCFYIYSSPPFLGYCAKELSKIDPVLYNAQDIFPDSLYSIKPIVKKTPFKWYFEKKEKLVYKHSSKIVTISNAMGQTIAKRCDGNNKIKTIYNWSDFNSLKHIERDDNTLFDEFNIPKDKFIVSYGGDVGMFQNWDVILDAFKTLKNSNVILVIFGNGSRYSYVQERIKNEGIDNVMVLPMQPKNRVSEVYSLGDLELVPLSKGLTSFALPSKLYNIFACQKAVLAMLDKNSEYFDLINTKPLGYAIEPSDLESLVGVIKDAFDNKTLLNKMGHNGLEYLKAECSRENQTRKYFDELSSISNK